MLLNAAYVIFWYTICFMVFHLLILVIAIQRSFFLHIFVKTVGNHKTAAYFIDYHRYILLVVWGLIIIKRGEGGLCWLELAYRSENDYRISANSFPNSFRRNYSFMNL